MWIKALKRYPGPTSDRMPGDVYDEYPGTALILIRTDKAVLAEKPTKEPAPEPAPTERRPVGPSERKPVGPSERKPLGPSERKRATSETAQAEEAADTADSDAEPQCGEHEACTESHKLGVGGSTPPSAIEAYAAETKRVLMTWTRKQLFKELKTTHGTEPHQRTRHADLVEILLEKITNLDREQREIDRGN